jgi:hypothetical protein
MPVLTVPTGISIDHDPVKPGFDGGVEEDEESAVLPYKK